MKRARPRLPSPLRWWVDAAVAAPTPPRPPSVPRARARERTLPPLPLVEERETMNESLYERGCWHDSLNYPQIAIGKKLDLVGRCTVNRMHQDQLTKFGVVAELHACMILV